jgi:PAS domain S-box-containing protein
MRNELRTNLSADGAPGGAEEQYRLLLECVADCAVFLLDTQGRVAAWNAAAERVFGYREDEALGMPSARFFTPEDVAAGKPQEELRTAAAQGRTSDDCWRLRKDGARLWVNGTATALRDEGGALRGFAQVCRDLTGQKRAGEALQASERRFRALVENAWDGISLVAADGTILENIPDNLTNLGYTPGEFVGLHAFQFAHPDDLPAMREAFARLLQTPGGRATAQYRLRHKDGSWRRVEAVGTNLLHEPAVGAVVVNYHDVTELTQRAAELGEMNQRKDEFLATLAHELRNPLAPIRNSVQVMRLRGPADPLHDVIDRQVSHLTRLVDDLLDVSRVTQGKVRLRTERVELAQAVADAVETCRPFIDAKTQELAVSLTPALVLEADPTRLAQVVGNILTNASKYTPEKGHIWLSAGREAGQVVLRVRDDGIGIREDMLPRVFDLFVQSERAQDRSQGGLGIGLTLVKSLVELHGGTVEAHSEGPGRGSEFVVRLPLLPGDAAVAARDAPEAAAPPPSRRVLVVDDNLDAAESLAMVLRLEGHEVQAVHEGAAVLEAARAFRPDVVLLDIGLPDGLTGYDLAPRLREAPNLEDVLLVALTGYGQEEDKRRAKQAGFDAHLTKPAAPGALQALLAAGRAGGKRPDLSDDGLFCLRSETVPDAPVLPRPGTPRR